MRRVATNRVIKRFSKDLDNKSPECRNILGDIIQGLSFHWISGFPKTYSGLVAPDAVPNRWYFDCMGKRL